jgi:hypothetical protein
MMNERHEEVRAELETLPPQTPVEITRGLAVRRKASGTPILSLHYSADPRRDPETPEGAAWYKSEKGSYPSEGDWLREQEIDDNAGGGELLLNPLLTKYKNKIIITDETWEPNPRWECVEGMDHGVSNATSMVKMYIDFNGDRYLAGEYYSWRRDPRGQDPGWGNEIWQNAPHMLTLHNLRKPRWCFADPSIFVKKEAQKDGTFTAVNASYRAQGVKFLQPYPSEQTRSDESYMTRLREHWGGLDRDGIMPTLYIVCRPHLDTGRRMPGLHLHDCPNLLWEWRRRKRAQLTDKQLQTRNQSEKVVDKDNHANDAHKYCEMPMPRPTKRPIEEVFAEEVIAKTEEILKERGQAPLNPMSQAVAAQRFMTIGQGAPRVGRRDLRNKPRGWQR